MLCNASQIEGEPEEPGVFEEWMEWTQCSTTCGLGRQARRRECRIREDSAEVDCTGRLLETRNCTQGPCPGITTHSTKHNSCFINGCTCVHTNFSALRMGVWRIWTVQCNMWSCREEPFPHYHTAAPAWRSGLPAICCE